ncbi:hypothetical protein BCON_0062g00290 [Botryotinia convoluta]|uniref:NAD-dependent epimerase/dehydratase domain-containing protein n=1 Tax=Botryotinia convoluta TaxID=54673 RepID=A0A4Z1I836_9HELO|nr:hypothetical protein BCON_0062g00290 [Botryotinia convoluta]
MSKRILLTEANGFVGSWVLDHLLRQGHFVRAVIRSESKAERGSSDFPVYESHFDFGIVPDITAPGAFDEVVKSDPSFDVVIHTASPFLYKVITNNREFLDPAIRGTMGVLESVKTNAPEVKRVVVTSSCAAIINFAREVVSQPQKASKKFAELASWDFVEKEKPNFDLVTLTPPMVYGPLRHTIQNGLHAFTDVRGLAEAHALAATLPEASGQRFIVCKGQISSQNISDILRKNIPELEERTPKGVPGDKGLEDDSFACSSEKAEKVLGLKFRSKEETFMDLARQLLEIEKKEKAVE